MLIYQFNSFQVWFWFVNEIAQSCLTLCDPMDCSLPGSSIHGIFQARILGWAAISFSRRSSRPRGWTWVSRIVGRRIAIWATRFWFKLAFFINPGIKEFLSSKRGKRDFKKIEKVYLVKDISIIRDANLEKFFIFVFNMLFITIFKIFILMQVKTNLS